MADEGSDSLESNAQQRKERLQALRAKRDKKEGNEGVEVKGSEIKADSSTKPKIKFRNYNPQSEGLKEKKVPKAKPEEVEPQIQEQLEAAKDAELGDVNLANLAPRKVDWDLKRDIAKKLEKLERRTQKAIVEIIRERLNTENDEVDLASAVATAGTEEQYDSD